MFTSRGYSGFWVFFSLLMHGSLALLYCHWGSTKDRIIGLACCFLQYSYKLVTYEQTKLFYFAQIRNIILPISRIGILGRVLTIRDQLNMECLTLITQARFFQCISDSYVQNHFLQTWIGMIGVFAGHVLRSCTQVWDLDSAIGKWSPHSQCSHFRWHFTARVSLHNLSGREFSFPG